MINLYTSYFQCNSSRKEELIFCLKQNLSLKEIQSVTVLNEAGDDLVLQTLKQQFPEKLRLVPIFKHVEYCDFFPFLIKNEMNVIANSDVFLDRTIRKINHKHWRKSVLGVLTRYEKDGKLFDNLGNSHDAWFFWSNTIPIDQIKLKLGVPYCEQRFAAELEDRSCIVVNPSKSIRIYHNHKTKEFKNKDRYEGACLIVKPTRMGVSILLIILKNILKSKGFSYRKQAPSSKSI